MILFSSIDKLFSIVLGGLAVLIPALFLMRFHSLWWLLVVIPTGLAILVAFALHAGRGIGPNERHDT